jgi:DNA mismatch repair protein MutL
MNVIKILSDQESKKIAAGEVVERPSSVVKELIENSIDAGAKKISLHVEKSGKQLIRVVDDGCGMSEQDAKTCFLNHATSKIMSLADLDDHKFFGFRGEALATISSVSKVVLETNGIRLRYVEGKFLENKKVSRFVGTDIFINDLFFNTPVRKKFLKQDETEWNQIQNLFYAFCLSNIYIHFKLFRDNKMVLNAPPIEKIKDRIMQIWGNNFAQNLTELDVQDKNLSIRGLISKHNFWRYGRQQIFFFVNGRWVKNKELSKGLIKGYRNVLPPARFPAAFLFFDVENDFVDINVHPRKEEVRFAKPVTVENLLHRAVTETLENFVSGQLGAAPDMSLDTISPQQVATKSLGTNGDTFASSSYISEFKNNPGETGMTLKDDSPVRCASRASESIACRSFSEGRQRGVKIIGQLLNTYIIIENDDGLLIIDQHAAHERILYEKFLKKFEKKDGTRLLFPEILHLNEHNQKIVLNEKEFLQNQGIEVEKIGDDQIAIKTSPPKVQNSDLKEIILELIEFVQENEELEKELFRKKLNEHVHSHLACKMAIKAGDKLSTEMMQNIVDQLNEVPNRFICVHGRPTTWKIDKLELEKKFRRK